MKRIGVVANPNAGRKLATIRAEELHSLLIPCGYQMRVHFTSKGENLREALRTFADHVDQLVVMGGDGTVNQVVNWLAEIEAPPPLAMYPMGTVNDFASYLEIPKNIREFAQMIQNPSIRKVDLGQAGERYFLNVAAGGLLPELAHRVSSEAKTVLGKFAYYMEGIREFPKQFFHPIPIQLEVEGKIKEKEILFFLAANSPFVGGFRNLVPNALIDDGLLELLVVETGELQDIANVLFNFLRRQLEPTLEPVKGITYYQVSEFKMYSPDVVDIDVDGELGGHLPLTFRAIKKRLEVTTPSRQ